MHFSIDIYPCRWSYELAKSSSCLIVLLELSCDKKWCCFDNLKPSTRCYLPLFMSFFITQSTLYFYFIPGVKDILIFGLHLIVQSHWMFRKTLLLMWYQESLQVMFIGPFKSFTSGSSIVFMLFLPFYVTLLACLCINILGNSSSWFPSWGLNMQQGKG